MTMTEGKEGLLEAVKQVGFPIVVAMALMYFVSEQMQQQAERFDRQQSQAAEQFAAQQLFITSSLSGQLERSTAVMSAINETIKTMANEQRETRAVMRSVLNQMDDEQVVEP